MNNGNNISIAKPCPAKDPTTKKAKRIETMITANPAHSRIAKKIKPRINVQFSVLAPKTRIPLINAPYIPNIRTSQDMNGAFQTS